MTCFEALEEILNTIEPSLKKKIRKVLCDSCESYHAALECKSRKTAIGMLKLFNNQTIEKIKLICKDYENLLTHVLCVNSANHKKYSQSLKCFWYENKVGTYIYRPPEVGDYMRSKFDVITPNGTKIGKKSNLKILKCYNDNSLDVLVETSSGDKFKYSCRKLRRINER